MAILNWRIGMRTDFDPTFSSQVEIRRQGTKVITSDAVLLEIGAALAKLAYRPAAIKFIDGLRTDPKVESYSRARREPTRNRSGKRER